MPESDPILLIPLLLPLTVGFAMLFIPNRNPSLRLFCSISTLLIATCTALLAFWLLLDGPRQFAWTLLHLEGFDLSLLLRVTPLRAFMLFFATVFVLAIALYSLDAQVLHLRRMGEYYGGVLLALGGSAGILLADHVLLLLICWEIVTVALYLLITTGKPEARPFLKTPSSARERAILSSGKDGEADDIKHIVDGTGRSQREEGPLEARASFQTGPSAAATKTFAMLGATDAALLLGLLLLVQYSGTWTISEMCVIPNHPGALIAFILLLIAAITKAGAMPLHTWLPVSGRVAPSAAMALLPASLDKLLGIYLLLVMVRQIFVIEPGALTTLLALIGAGTIILAVMVAMVQHNLKQLLSYHAISQVGYMVLGIATGTTVGIAGGVFHMLNHAIYKSCLFLCGGAVEQQTSTTELDQLGGLGRKMPVTFTACLIAALSISGIPPFNGFVSKWMVYQGIIAMGATQHHLGAQLWPLWLTAAMFGSALTLASFVKLLHSVFLSRCPEDLRDVKGVSPFQAVPMVVLALMCVVFGVAYRLPLHWFVYPALGLTGDVTIGTWNSAWATALLLIGILVAIGILVWAGFFAHKIREVSTWTCGEKQPNDQMIIPGTHFYKTISTMKGFKSIYQAQDKGRFDLYRYSGLTGLSLTRALRYLHTGALPVYLTWVTLGLLALILCLCHL